MNVVDSSGWLEYFADGPNAEFFAPAIHNPEKLIVPTLSLYEVFRKMRKERDQGMALEAVAQMQQGRLIPLDAALAVAAAEISLAHKLPMADSIMLATARAHDAVLWTQDEDFEGLEGVKYVSKQE